MHASSELQTRLYARQKLLMRTHTSQAQSLLTLREALSTSKEWTKGEIVNSRTQEVLLTNHTRRMLATQMLPRLACQPATPLPSTIQRVLGMANISGVGFIG